MPMPTPHPHPDPAKGVLACLLSIWGAPPEDSPTGPHRRRRGRRGKGRLVVMPSATEFAKAVAKELKPAVQAVFITETNADQVCGQTFDWVVSVARRLGVPIANPTGKKIIIDIEVLRRALAAPVPRPIEPAEDPVTAVRRMLAERLNGGRNAPKA